MQQNTTITNADEPDKIITVTTVLNCSADNAFNYLLIILWKALLLEIWPRRDTVQKNFMNNVRSLTNVTVIFSKVDDKKVTLINTGWRQDENR